MAANSAAYDFERFDSAVAAPLATPETRRVPRQNVYDLPKVNIKQLHREMRMTSLKAARWFSLVAAVAIILGFSINSRSRLTELNSKIVKAQTQLSELRSENTRLDMQLNSKVSLDKVEEYAVNNLGMVKRDRYQIVYFDLSEGNRAVIPE